MSERHAARVTRVQTIRSATPKERNNEEQTLGIGGRKHGIKIRNLAFGCFDRSGGNAENEREGLAIADMKKALKRKASKTKCSPREAGETRSYSSGAGILSESVRAETGSCHFPFFHFP